MKIKIDSPVFQEQILEVEPASFFSGAKLYFNHKHIPLKRSKAEVVLDNGEPVELQLKFNFFDAYPKVLINGEEQVVGGELTIIERIFILLPFSLAAIGGAIGGGLGAYTAHVNGTLIREYRDEPLKKYGLCVVGIVVAFLIYILLATLIHLIFQAR